MSPILPNHYRFALWFFRTGVMNGVMPTSCIKGENAHVQHHRRCGENNGSRSAAGNRNEEERSEGCPAREEAKRGRKAKPAKEGRPTEGGAQQNKAEVIATMKGRRARPLPEPRLVASRGGRSCLCILVQHFSVCLLEIFLAGQAIS
jgi:hypothetical protein